MSKIKKRWIVVTVVLVLITNVCTGYFSKYISVKKSDGGIILSDTQYQNYKQFEKLYGIKDIINKNYDGDIDKNLLLEGAIKGMTESLKDPYTVFMNQKEYSDFTKDVGGTYAGIGIQIKSEDNKLKVVSAFDGSPAKKAGLIKNDVIYKINGEVITGNDIDKAVTLMTGKVDKDITLTIIRQDEGALEIHLKTAVIKINTISGEMLNSQIGYISIAQFDENTGANFAKELKDLKAKGMKGLIIDIRDNPGGTVDQCQIVTSNFIKKGQTIVTLTDKNGNSDVYKSFGGDALGMPLVVLVNDGSASASEIFSGAIRDYKAGTLVGIKTFGKGIAQSVLNTGEGTALKITTAKYYLPSGENIHHKGIQPDVVVEYPAELLKKEYDRKTDPQFKKAMEIIQEKVK